VQVSSRKGKDEFFKEKNDTYNLVELLKGRKALKNK